MTSIAHKYADFSGTQSEGNDTENQMNDAMEDQKLQSFEEGYQAGWADATSALQTEQQKLASEFSQNIQDMSFTYHEALAKLMHAFRPLVEQIATQILPKAAGASLSGHIAQELNALIENQIGGEIEISVSPGSLKAAKGLLAKTEADVPFKIRADPSLSGGQVYLKVGNAEREINLDAVTQGIVKAIDAFFEQTTLEPIND